MKIAWETKAKAIGVKRRRANSSWMSTYAHAFMARCIFCAVPIKRKREGGEYAFIQDQPKGVRPQARRRADPPGSRLPSMPQH